MKADEGFNALTERCEDFVVAGVIGRDFYDIRAKVTVRAEKFGVAVRPAPIHASEQRFVDTSPLAHQSRSVHAGAGSANPNSASTCSNVSTTIEA